jgi:serine/threonine protein kinase
VVSFFDAFSEVEQGRVGIVMEYLGGGSLEDLVKAGGCQDESMLAKMSAQILKVGRCTLTDADPLWPTLAVGR